MHPDCPAMRYYAAMHTRDLLLERHTLTQYVVNLEEYNKALGVSEEDTEPQLIRLDAIFEVLTARGAPIIDYTEGATRLPAGALIHDADGNATYWVTELDIYMLSGCLDEEGLTEALCTSVVEQGTTLEDVRFRLLFVDADGRATVEVTAKIAAATTQPRTDIGMLMMLQTRVPQMRITTMKSRVSDDRRTVQVRTDAIVEMTFGNIAVYKENNQPETQP